MKVIQVASCVALLAAAAAAQTPLGVLRNVPFSFVTRGVGTQVQNPTVNFTRFDADRYAAFGVDPAQPGVRQILGVRCLLEDLQGATVDPVAFRVMTADPLNTGYPDAQNPIATTGTFTLPVGSGPVAYDASLAFQTPVTLPVGADLYVGVFHLNPMLPSLLDGSLVGVTMRLLLRPGAAAPTTAPDDTYSGWYVPATGTLTYGYQQQYLIEPLVATGGVASAMVASALTPFPGHSGMFVSQYPDAANPPLNAGRADDLGMTFVRPGLPAGSLVFFFGDFTGAFAPEVPLANLLPGSTGAFCIDPTVAVSFGLTVSTGAATGRVTAIAAAARPLLTGISIVQQAVALDVTTLVAHAGPGQRSSF